MQIFPFRSPPPPPPRANQLIAVTFKLKALDVGLEVALGLRHHCCQVKSEGEFYFGDGPNVDETMRGKQF